MHFSNTINNSNSSLPALELSSHSLTLHTNQKSNNNTNRLAIQFFLFALSLPVIQIVFIVYATTLTTTETTNNFSSSSDDIGSNINSIRTIDQNESQRRLVRKNEDKLSKQETSAIVSEPVQEASRDDEIRANHPMIRYDIVEEYDHIYNEINYGSWDSAPIVIESHKLIFFTIPKVGDTIWKQLFRRMNNATDWSSSDSKLLLPHNPERNGLKYFNNYTKKQASVMMTSPEWTRAIMIQEPKRRSLNSYIDIAIEHSGDRIRSKCCNNDDTCVSRAIGSVQGFLSLAKSCNDDYWRSQTNRLDAKYWPYVNYVLHYENAANDAKGLLEKVGAWDAYGAHGWGRERNQAIFETDDKEWQRFNEQKWAYYTPDNELSVELFYRDDYGNNLFQYKRGDCVTCVDRSYVDIIQQKQER